MLRTYVYERTYVLLKYDPRLKYPLCYDPLVPWPCYAPRHKGQVDFKLIQGKIALNPLHMRRKFAIICQCSVGVYQDFLTTDHNLNLNFI